MSDLVNMQYALCQRLREAAAAVGDAAVAQMTALRRAEEPTLDWDVLVPIPPHPEHDIEVLRLAHR